MGTDMFSDRAKQSAFQKACATHGAAGIEYTCSGSITDARELGRRLDHEPDCPGAFIVFSDYIAGGVIRGLVDEGRRVPEDTAVVGMDGTAMGEFSTPALTTIAQDCRQLMVRSIDLLLEKIEHRETSAKEILLPTQLIVRESA